MSSLLGAVSASFGNLLNKSGDSPQTSLCILFCLYKSLLNIIAFCSPDDGFDSSTILAGWPDGGPISKLIKWDAIWFANLAQRGYKYEQDYAFGLGHTNLMSLGKYLGSADDFNSSIQRVGLFGIFISHLSHLVGALLVYRIALIVFRNHERGERIAFLGACFHVLSPAGIFLCAPYTEVPFSVLKYGAYFAYASATLNRHDGKSLYADFETIISGALLGTSCTFRSNGLLSGVIFFMDAVEEGLLFLKHRGDFVRFRKIVATGIAGLLVALGQSYPQLVAYMTFCTDTNPNAEKRPFCYSIPPSIYTYVQHKYWDVGLFHYWQPQQIPLFILASPMLFAMFYSSYWVYQLYKDPIITKVAAIEDDRQPLVQDSTSLERVNSDLSKEPVSQIDMRLLIRFTIPQLLIALTCLFMVHVQIITRLSSAYPVWYWWLAVELLDYIDANPKAKGWKRWLPVFYIKFIILYGVIQAGLYAEMMPPA